MRVAVTISCTILLMCLQADNACAQSGAVSTGETSAMEKVMGIGGFFFRAADPKSLAEWYERHLGVTRTPESYAQEPWQQTAGPTVFAPFPKNTRYFGAEGQPWMINFRVRDLDAMVSQLRRAGIVVEVDPESHPNGRFARLKDPEGNPVQLWEPRQPGEAR